MNMVESLLIALTDSQNARGQLEREVVALRAELEKVRRAETEPPGD
jgi:hypothetical protein